MTYDRDIYTLVSMLLYGSVTMCLLLISSYLWDGYSYAGCVLPFNNIASALLLERDYFKDPPDGCHLMWVLSLIFIYIHERVYIIKSFLYISYIIMLFSHCSIITTTYQPLSM